MKTGIINRKTKITFVSIAMFLTVYACAVSCKSTCEQEISVYQGLFFKEGQVRLLIDNELVFEKEYDDDYQRNNLKEIRKYCCLKDSCLVKFTLGVKDTTFFLLPGNTKKLMFGADVNGNFSIATDNDRNAWIKM